MWIIRLVGYVGTVVAFSFLALAIASGLYYLSELVEEHTVIAKRILTRLIYTVMGTLALLWLVDGFPFTLTLFAIFSHFIYLTNMRKFPYVMLSDPLFILSGVLVVANHWLWFRHMSHRHERAYQSMSSYYEGPADVPTFSQTASFFGLCVWLVPFALFISLSASENVLPTMGSTDMDGTNSRQGMVKAMFDSILERVAEVSASLGYRRREE